MSQNLMDTLLADHRTGQDVSQLNNFVLGGRTPWGTYKQALRELYKRIRGLRQMITDHELLLIDIEEFEEKIEIEESERDLRRHKLKLRQMYSNLEESDRGIRDTKREAALFYRTAAELKKQFGEIDEERRIQLDREDWKWWHVKRTHINGRMDDVTIKNLISLPQKERVEWLEAINTKREETIERSEFGRELPKVATEEEIKLIEQEISR